MTFASSSCNHSSACPSASSHAFAAAAVVASHPEQGWSKLCNGVIVFDDLGFILPDGAILSAPAPVYAPLRRRAA